MAELTQDFKILPHNNRIKEIIEEDARSIAINIQQEVVEKIEENRGTVTVRKEISDLYRGFVIKTLQQWVKIHEYKLDVDGDNFTIYSPARKFKLSVSCKECGKRVKNLKHWLIGFGGLFSAISSAVAFNYFLYLEFDGGAYGFCATILNVVYLSGGGIGVCYATDNHYHEQHQREHCKRCK